VWHLNEVAFSDLDKRLPDQSAALLTGDTPEGVDGGPAFLVVESLEPLVDLFQLA
jgi:hypothetical protein